MSFVWFWLICSAILAIIIWLDNSFDYGAPLSRFFFIVLGPIGLAMLVYIGLIANNRGY